MMRNNKEYNELETKITQTRAQIEKLGVERGEFGQKMREAVENGEAQAIMDLRRRSQDIPVEVDTARIRLAQFELELDELRLPELQAEVGKFHQPIQSAISKRDAATLELGQLQGQYHSVNEDLREVRIRIGERKRELERLMYEATPKSPGLRQPLLSMSGR
jgi:peptidoglycan hydrolase CwlO-like protein